MDEARPLTYEMPSWSGDERFREFRQFDHLRLYGVDFPERLSAAGFTILIDQYARTLDPGDGQSACDGISRHVCTQ
jgi:hypothetical protein